MENYNFKFGLNRDHDPSLGIHKGRITLSNEELKLLFDEVVNEILESCLNTLTGREKRIGKIRRIKQTGQKTVHMIEQKIGQKTEQNTEQTAEQKTEVI
jgi:hypothetical protein